MTKPPHTDNNNHTPVSSDCRRDTTLKNRHPKSVSATSSKTCQVKPTVEILEKKNK